jgi:hypothetical protein
MVQIFKALAAISAGFMELIIGLIGISKFFLIKAVIAILTFPLYLYALILYFIFVGVADMIKRKIGKGGFYPDREGLKDLEYYANYGVAD